MSTLNISDGSPPQLKTIDVVLIGRNEAHHLPATLHAAKTAIAQLPMEIWRANLYYVDSQSTDNSVEIAQNHGATIILAHPNFQSPSNGRTSGFLLTNGELVMFLDADCELDPAWLCHGIEFLDANPNAGAVAGIEEKLRLVGNKQILMKNYDFIDSEIERASPLIMTGTILARRSAVLAAGIQEPFPISSTDRYMYFQMERAGWPVFRIRKPMMRHHDQHLGNLTHLKKKASRMLITAFGRGALLRHSIRTGVWRSMLVSLKPELVHLNFIAWMAIGLIFIYLLRINWLWIFITIFAILYIGLLIKRKHSTLFGMLALATLTYYSIAVLIGFIMNMPRMNWGVHLKPEYKNMLLEINPTVKAHHLQED